MRKRAQQQRNRKRILIFFCIGYYLLNGLVSYGQVDSVRIVFLKPNIDTWASICCQGDNYSAYETSSGMFYKSFVFRSKSFLIELGKVFISNKLVLNRRCPDTRFLVEIYHHENDPLKFCCSSNGVFEVGDAVFFNKKFTDFIFNACKISKDGY